VNYQDKTSSDPTHVTSIPAFTIANAALADLSQRWDDAVKLTVVLFHRGEFIEENGGGAGVRPRQPNAR
jgi:hypothetical protein